jgi:single-stranded-DNA-specific exonuclease
MNLVEALTHCSDLLVKYGGHELAAGLSVKRQDLPEFRRRINEYARNIFTEGDSEIVLEADGVLAPEEITTSLAVQSASLIEPCGAGNPTPAFILMDATVTAIRAVGSGKHCKLSLEAGGRYFNAMYFGISPAELSCERGDGVDVLFNVGINQYMGRKELQLTVIDVRPSERAINQLRAQEARVADILAGGRLSARDMPGRKDMVNLYSIICELGASVSLTDRYALYLLRTKLPERDMIGYVKYKLIVEIFASTGIFNIRKTVCDECVTSFEKVEHKNKIDIEGSELFLSLKSRIGEDV